jgi:hypothetical protein
MGEESPQTARFLRAVVFEQIARTFSPASTSGTGGPAEPF